LPYFLYILIHIFLSKSFFQWADGVNQMIYHTKHNLFDKELTYTNV